MFIPSHAKRTRIQSRAKRITLFSDSERISILEEYLQQLSCVVRKQQSIIENLREAESINQRSNAPYLEAKDEAGYLFAYPTNHERRKKP